MQINEIKSLRNPPKLVKITLEAVCIILGNRPKKMKDWRECKKVFCQSKFILNVLQFDTLTLKKKSRKILYKDYISIENFIFDKVNRSSRACGPLCLWVHAQWNFSQLLIVRKQNLTVYGYLRIENGFNIIQDIICIVIQYYSD